MLVYMESTELLLFSRLPIFLTSDINKHTHTPYDIDEGLIGNNKDCQSTWLLNTRDTHSQKTPLIAVRNKQKKIVAII